jgi:hypothetical protein
MSTHTSGLSVIKRKGYAKDIRTGQTVRVLEHGMGADYKVATAYKSDGYWVDRNHLVPASDPHAWGAWEGVKFVLIVLTAAWSAYAVHIDLMSYDVSLRAAFFSADLPTGYVVFALLGKISGLARI